MRRPRLGGIETGSKVATLVKFTSQLRPFSYTINTQVEVEVELSQKVAVLAKRNKGAFAGVVVTKDIVCG